MRSVRILASAGMLLGAPSVPVAAHAGAVSVRPFAVASGGFDTNPLVLDSAAVASGVASVGAGVAIDAGFGPFNRLYTQSGVVYTRLTTLRVATLTGYTDLRVVRRLEVGDAELRVTGQGSSIQSEAPAPRAGGSLDLSSLAASGENWSAAGSAAMYSPPTALRGGLAAVGAWTSFPRRRDATGRAETLTQRGALALGELREGPLLAQVAFRGLRQDSTRDETRGQGVEAFAGTWLTLAPDVLIRARAEGRLWRFPDSGGVGRTDRTAVGQLGVTLGSVGRPLRVDLALTAMGIDSTQPGWNARRTGGLVSVEWRPRRAPR